MVLAYLRHLENAHYQMLEGTLDVQYLDNWAGNPTFGLPHFPVFWEQRRGVFNPDFREYLEARRGLR